MSSEFGVTIATPSIMTKDSDKNMEDSDNKDTAKVEDTKSETETSTQETAPNAPQTETVSLEAFQAMQKQLMEAQSRIEHFQKEKDDVLRNSFYEELEKINPKLAEDNKDADLSTLGVILKTAKEVRGNFKTHSADKGSEAIKKENPFEKRYNALTNGWE